MIDRPSGHTLCALTQSLTSFIHRDINLRHSSSSVTLCPYICLLHSFPFVFTVEMELTPSSSGIKMRLSPLSSSSFFLFLARTVGRFYHFFRAWPTVLAFTYCFLLLYFLIYRAIQGRINIQRSRLPSLRALTT